MNRPPDLFDREWEWEQLVRFATSESRGSTLGVMSGRRRQGKTYLLQALCDQLDGFFYEAVEATEEEALRHFAGELASFAGMPAPPAFGSWAEAVDAALKLGEGPDPVLVVFDEFPFLVSASPSLPSVIQAALSPRSAARTRYRTRLLLCGSAVSFMGKLLSRDAPLRGRAGLDLIVHTFDYRAAADFWGLRSNPRLALLVHATAGGTPAYRREFVSSDAPRSLKDFDSWVLRRVLNPASPLFREGRYLLAEEPGLRDTGLYHSVLSAVAFGKTTRNEIAGAIGRTSPEITHVLNVLEDSGFLVRAEDAFRRRRPTFSIGEPIVRFDHAVMRPEWARLERPGGASEIWPGAKQRFMSAIVGPHFEQVCREWTATVAPGRLFAGETVSVSAGILNDRRGRSLLQVDVVATDPRPGRERRIVAVGEAKWGRKLDDGHLAKLRRVCELLRERDGYDVSDCRLLLFSGSGFSRGIENAASRGEVQAVDLETLYA